MAKKKVFISHISSETELAQLLKQQLVKDFLGLLDIFVSSDQESIPAGTNWLEAVEKALLKASLQIVLCSKESVGRPWVNFEAGAAWLRGIKVIPACHSGMKPHELPLPLILLEGFEVGQPAGVEKLYQLVARQLAVSVPAADFGAIAAKLKALEEQYVRVRHGGVDRVESPRILCAASEQFADPALGFEDDVRILQSAFPNRVTIERKLTRKRLVELTTNQLFDIIHLVLYVDRDTGDLVFGPVDRESGVPTTSKVDRMSAASFASLLGESKTRLVVMATCKALLLAVEVHTVANMAASDAEITGAEAAEWADSFYGFLASGKSVHKAFALTKEQIGGSMRPVLHRDVCFGSATGTTEAA